MKIKIKDVTKKVLPLVIIPFILTGCGQKSDCEIPSRHIHKFVSNNGIVKYLDSEQKQYGNYNWQKDYLEITNDDALFFKTKGNLFEGDDNWKYLYNVMKSNSKDYLTFHYHYTTTSTYTTTDSKGHTHTHTRTNHHSGWSEDPTHRGVDGDVRINHHKFYGYRIVKKNGEYIKEQSPIVDDFRDIINDYPFFFEYKPDNTIDSLFDDENCVVIVYHEYEFDRNVLTRLKVTDFNDFTGPNLTNTELAKTK